MDVVHTSDAGHFVLLKDKKLLAKYTPAGVDGFPAGFKDKDGYYYGLRATVNVIAYNTRSRPGRRGAEDLEGPARSQVEGQAGHRASRATAASSPPTCWRSCTCTAGTTSSSSPRTSSMLVQSAVDPAGVVASGERPVAVNGGDYTFYQVKKKGNPVEIVYPKEGVPLVVSPTAITSFAPHPNAARLFTDFTFSREVQQVMADSEGLYTGHPEVKYPADKPKLGELKLLTVDPEELEKRNEEIKKRFVEFFGA